MSSNATPKYEPPIYARISEMRITREQAAAAAGVSVMTLHRVATGERFPRINDAMSLATLLGWNLEQVEAAITEAREHHAREQGGDQ